MRWPSGRRAPHWSATAPARCTAHRCPTSSPPKSRHCARYWHRRERNSNSPGQPCAHLRPAIRGGGGGGWGGGGKGVEGEWARDGPMRRAGRPGLPLKKILEKKRGVPTWKKLHSPSKGRLHPMGATKPHGYADGQCHWVPRWITANFSHPRSPMEAPMKLLHINASTRGENSESL